MTNDTVHSYSYDAEGNILKVDGGSTAVYVYDALNQRVHVQTASATNEFAYDYAGRRVSTWLSPNNYGNEGRIYWDGQQIAFRSTDGTTYFEHQDTLGTERMRTNYGGSVGSKYVSLPWGDGYTATVNASGADQDNLHFAGLEHDAESDTEHAQFRNYASAQGRWLAPDPYMGSYDPTNPQSMNRYAYVLDNPTSFIDPRGLDSGFDCGDGCVGVTGTTTDLCPYDGPTRTTPIPVITPVIPKRAPNKSLLKGLYCFAMSDVLNLSQLTGKTVGVGGGVSAGAGLLFTGFYGSVGVQRVADPQGNVGIAFTYGAGLPLGLGAQAGGQVSLSTAQSINDLSGPSYSLSGSSGSIGLDLSKSQTGGPITATVTIGPGVGTKMGIVGGSQTSVGLTANCN